MAVLGWPNWVDGLRGRRLGREEKETGLSAPHVGFAAFEVEAEGQAWPCSVMSKPPGAAL